MILIIFKTNLISKIMNKNFFKHKNIVNDYDFKFSLRF